MYIFLIALLILFVCVAMIFNEGLWGAALMFFNVLVSALLATNFFEPLANWLASLVPTMAYLWDFVAAWAVFALSLGILRLITGMLSRHKVRFIRPLDLGGGILFAAWVGWIMVQFTLFTFHLAPLGRNFLAGQFQETPESTMVFGADRNWLSFAHYLSSEGALAREASESNPTAYQFDPQGDFILKYGARRKQLEKEPGILVDTKRANEP